MEKEKVETEGNGRAKSGREGGKRGKKCNEWVKTKGKGEEREGKD